MTDAHPDPRDASPDTGKTKKVPPLAWIIGALLVLMIAIGVSQYDGTHVTPSGGAMPQKVDQAPMPQPAPEGAPSPSAG